MPFLCPSVVKLFTVGCVWEAVEGTFCTGGEAPPLPFSCEGLFTTSLISFDGKQFTKVCASECERVFPLHSQTFLKKSTKLPVSTLLPFIFRCSPY